LTLAALRGLRPFGRHLIVGYSSGEIPQIPANYVLLKQVSVVGVSFRQCVQNTPLVAQAALGELVAMWETGKLKPHIAQVHPFERFGDAVSALSARSAVGKHVVRIADM
jgi:NADPH2:quinone reductase